MNATIFHTTTHPLSVHLHAYTCCDLPDGVCVLGPLDQATINAEVDAANRILHNLRGYLVHDVLQAVSQQLAYAVAPR